MDVKYLIATAYVLAVLSPAAHAQTPESGDWLVRVRALHLNSANKDSTGLDLSINNRWFPELDVSYFITPNIATELVVTYPQEHNVRAGGTKIGDLRHLPPTLSLQYHVTEFPGFRPYVGAGVNYTRFSSVTLPAGVSVKKTSLGLALGAGVDVPVGGGWLVNADIKKVQLDTHVRVAGSKIGRLQVDPVLFSIGVGRRF